MKRFRVYGSYVQRVYVDVVAQDADYASDAACDMKLNEWVQDSTIEPHEITQDEIDFLGEIR